ncbi:RsmF rRNA methyltransferase first C-terminal domain-containing protein [Ureibacillus sp. MALMAid1270]|uniref:RsmF rRNA methyltransferase first C-terminal domain-containing protein n=1 Tax=Ureibacillus sp. MALMAid1270 TaxID=3411629 RepID=UPI003BA3EB4B
MKLPEPFLLKMKNLLQDEFDAFIQSYNDEKSHALRVNTLKIDIAEFLHKNPFTLERIPWVETGFFYPHNDRPGKHPYHEAGLYYIQEPSAMAVGEFVDPKPGERVLDLCAAPGGKTTHLASKMKGEGFLLSNEIHPARAKILSQNVERMGIKNTVVTNETPERLAERFPSFFDRILVDAPCSGEGMFRKDEEAREHWSLENVEICASRQIDILKSAATMLKPGGRLVYSTCTFSPEENEGTISRFLEQHPNFEIVEVQSYKDFSRGRKDWVENPAENIEKTIRLWPHLMKGEGHYIAVLKKVDGDSDPRLKLAQPKVDSNMLKHYKEFAKETLNFLPTGKYITFNDQLYLLPEETLSLDKLKVVRPGLHLGTFKKNRFEPSHALALSLNREEVKNSWNLSVDSKEIISYLKGEVLQANGEKGWYLIEVDGYSIGWGKLAGNAMKNHYPKGLRWVGNFY